MSIVTIVTFQSDALINNCQNRRNKRTEIFFVLAIESFECDFKFFLIVNVS